MFKLFASFRHTLIAGALLAALTPLQAQEPVADRSYSAFAVSPAFIQQVEQDRLARSLVEPTPYERKRRRWKKAWIASWVAFAAVNALDAHSSLGRRELNPLLRNADGRFSAGRAAALKGGVGAGLFLWQLHQIRQKPEKNYYRSFTWMTGAAAGALGGVAIYNYTGD